MKIAKLWEIEECNNGIMQLMAKVLPSPDNYPATAIHIYVRDEENGNVQWAVQFTQPPFEFSKLVMQEDGLPEEEKSDLILIIGDERVPNGLYLLYSQVEGNILQCKFHTKEEALFYTEVFSMKQYRPYFMTKSFARYPWFNGKKKHPAAYGFQPAQISWGDKET